MDSRQYKVKKKRQALDWGGGGALWGNGSNVIPEALPTLSPRRDEAGVLMQQDEVTRRKTRGDFEP